MSKLTLKSNIEDALLSYLEYCEIERDLSQNTIKMYDFYLRDFIGWAKSYKKRDTISLEEIDDELVKKYRIDLNRRISSKSNLEFKKSTQKTFLIAIRAFLKFLVVVNELDLLAPEKIILGKGSESVPKVLNEDQLSRMFEVQDLNKISGIRDHAILEVLFSTGLRVSELVNLNVGDINLNSKEFTVLGKGRKVRTVYLSDSAVTWLKRYLGTRDDPYVPLFLRYSGKHMEPGDFDGESLRLTQRSVQRLVKKYTKRAGVSVDATPHTLRHTFATGLLREGADLRSVQELLGHSNVATTQIYTHVTNMQLKDVHKRFHKKAEIKETKKEAISELGENEPLY
ncbi:tyrosine-type recombinase/integrase [Patescibacteria group bacterium]|nr:tyrosine-type recombinase/integrase [Patescibacteria group bacterium]